MRGGHLGRPRLVSGRDRCCPGYPGNSSGVSSCFDRKTSATRACPERMAAASPVRYPSLQTSYLSLLPISPDPERLKHGRTCKTSGGPFQKETSHLDKRLISARTVYFCFFTYKKRGRMVKIFGG